MGLSNSPFRFTHDRPKVDDGSCFVISLQVDCDTIEEAWVRPSGDGLYELCSVPFALKDISFGDIFRVTEQGGSEVVRRRGSYSYRVFSKTSNPGVDQVLQFVLEYGLVYEVFGYLISICAPDYEVAVRLVELLNAMEYTDEFDWEAANS